MAKHCECLPIVVSGRCFWFLVYGTGGTDNGRRGLPGTCATGIPSPSDTDQIRTGFSMVRLRPDNLLAGVTEGHTERMRAMFQRWDKMWVSLWQIAPITSSSDAIQYNFTKNCGSIGHFWIFLGNKKTGLREQVQHGTALNSDDFNNCGSKMILANLAQSGLVLATYEHQTEQPTSWIISMPFLARAQRQRIVVAHFRRRLGYLLLFDRVIRRNLVSIECVAIPVGCCSCADQRPETAVL